MNLKVSLVLTVLNEEQSIEKTVGALLNQSYPAEEIVVVDGGSSDHTEEILEKMVRKHSKLRVLTKKGNRSVGRNYAISQTKNQLIAITDAGCVAHPDWLEKLVTKYQQTQAPVVAGYYDAQPQTTLQTAIIPYVLVMPDKVNEATFLPATRSMLIEKQAWQAVGGFDDRLNDNEDYAFAHQLRKHAFSIAMSREAKVSWLPRTTLASFWFMIFRFARGDMEAGLIRPKVLFIFARYFLGLSLISWLFILKQPIGLFIVLVVGFWGYSAWAVVKNKKYTPDGWYWLPILQYLADIAVIMGSLTGMVKRLSLSQKFH